MKIKGCITFLAFVLCGMVTAQNAIDPLKGNTTVISKPAIIDSSQLIADKIVNSKTPVLVDFWAPWCGPCKMLNPIIKELEKEYDQKVVFIKVNVDIHKAIAAYFGITAIPAVFIIKDKAVVKMLPGLQNKDSYKEALDEVLLTQKTAPKKIPAE